MPNGIINFEEQLPKEQGEVIESRSPHKTEAAVVAFGVQVGNAAIC